MATYSRLQRKFQDETQENKQAMESRIKKPRQTQVIIGALFVHSNSGHQRYKKVKQDNRDVLKICSLKMTGHCSCSQWILFRPPKQPVKQQTAKFQGSQQVQTNLRTCNHHDDRRNQYAGSSTSSSNTATNPSQTSQSGSISLIASLHINFQEDPQKHLKTQFNFLRGSMKIWRSHPSTCVQLTVDAN